MTSLLTSAAIAPFVMALVPCLFLAPKAEAAPVASAVTEASGHDGEAPWWKPTALGIDNFS